MSERLSLSNFAQLPDEVTRPKYNVSSHKAGIVHIGIGAFHRGHQAVFTDDAIAHSGGDWRIIGISLRSPMVSKQLNPQNGLYTVTERSSSQQKTRLIGAIEKVLVAPLDPNKVVQQLASSEIKVITLTVTEKGYHYDMTDCALDEENTDIKHDIQHPKNPVSMPGFIVAACAERMKNVMGNYKLSVISCDNLPENGKITQTVVTALARKISPELVTWINANVTFCSSMVDRIVPAVTEQDKSKMASRLGLIDNAMIQTETFKQWVIEDNFCTPIPNWESAGALIVDNVESYEKLKLRTLNGSHSALAYMGVLLGYKWIHEAIANPLLLKAIEQLMINETGPSLVPPANFDLLMYQKQIIARFQNKEIAYATQQVAMDGSQKLVQRIFTPIIDNKAKRKTHRNSAVLITVVAAWMLYLKGQDEASGHFEIQDPLADKLCKIAQVHLHEPHKYVHAFMTQTNVFPPILANDEEFILTLTNTLINIKGKGLAFYLQDLLHA